MDNFKDDEINPPSVKESNKNHESGSENGDFDRENQFNNDSNKDENEYGQNDDFMRKLILFYKIFSLILFNDIILNLIKNNFC